MCAYVCMYICGVQWTPCRESSICMNTDGASNMCMNIYAASNICMKSPPY